jgi:hypothetical protein
LISEQEIGISKADPVGEILLGGQGDVIGNIPTACGRNEAFIVRREKSDEKRGGSLQESDEKGGKNDLNKGSPRPTATQKLDCCPQRR